MKKNLILETTIEICLAEKAAKRYRGQTTGDGSAKAAATYQYRRQNTKASKQSRMCKKR